MSAKLTDKKSIQAVIEEMTLEEKASLITGGSTFYTCAIERLGIPAALLVDGGTGLNVKFIYMDSLYRHEKRVKKLDDSNNVTGMEVFGAGLKYMPTISDPSKLPLEEQEIVLGAIAQTEAIKPKGISQGCFPPGMMLGATWDPETVYQCANALGKEINAFQVDVLLGSPNVNIHRDPLNGRVFEGYSEDPCLVSKLAPNFVKGIQDEGVVANVKHFVANNQETERMGINENIPERALHEIYFPGFKACVQEGGVKTVMSAYNKINGKACALNSWLLTDVLRKMWGFEGFVMSDWGAAYDQVLAAEAGNDLVMPGPRSIQPIIDAVKSNKLSESTIDKCVANILGILLEMPVMKGRKYTGIDTENSKNAAYRTATEGMVLLKNSEELLPLKKTAKVSFFGERSKKFIESGGGSAEVWTDLSTNLYDCTTAKIGIESVTYGEIKDNTDVVVIAVAAKGQEGRDRLAMDIESNDKEVLLEAVAKAKATGKKIVVVLNIAGPVQMSEWLDDVDAVVCVFFPGMEGGRAAVDILFGDLNPSGKLPLTFPKDYKDCPTYGNFPGEAGEVWYGEGIYVGYRYYDFKGVEPLYPFGFGLSYTTFKLSDIRIQSPVVNFDNGERVKVFVKVKNTGKMAGKEVVQLYTADEMSSLNKPPKELKAFKKVYLEPGEEKDICLELGKDDLASFDTSLKQWITEPGYYQVLIGNSSRNINLTERFNVIGENPYGFGPNTGIGKLFSDKDATAVIRKHLKEFNIEPLDLVSAEMIFFPTMRFSVSWEKSFAPLLTIKTVTEKNVIREAIYKDLKELGTVTDQN